MMPIAQLVSVANVPSPRSARVASVPMLNPMNRPQKGSRIRKNRHPPKANSTPRMTASNAMTSCM